MCKAYTSDMARLATGDAPYSASAATVFTEEVCPAELYQDVVIYGIWEGTNFIQAQDYTGRSSP